MKWIYLSSLSALKGLSSIGGVRLIFSLFFIYALTKYDGIAYNGRLSFICHPETNAVHKEECYSMSSAEMSRLMRPYFSLLVTAFILIALWTTMILYSLRHLPKIRRVKVSSEREHLCLEFWKMMILHVSSETVALSFILGLFCYSQKIHIAATHNCTLIVPVMTCLDVDHQLKSILNILFIGGMAFILFLCIATVYQAVYNKENFIKELLVLSTQENGAGKERL